MSSEKNDCHRYRYVCVLLLGLSYISQVRGVCAIYVVYMLTDCSNTFTKKTNAKNEDMITAPVQQKCTTASTVLFIVVLLRTRRETRTPVARDLPHKTAVWPARLFGFIILRCVCSSFSVLGILPTSCIIIAVSSLTSHHCCCMLWSRLNKKTVSVCVTRPLPSRLCVGASVGLLYV